MKTAGLDRQIITQNVSSAYSAQLTDDQIICDATSAGFQVTLYQINDGADHELIVAIDPDDSSGNTVTITDGSFSTTLDSAGGAVTLAVQYDGTWMIAGQYPVTSSAAATSKADSAALRASVAQSGVTSNSINISVAGSGVTSNSINVSVADSKAVSDSVVISTLTTTSNSKDTSQSVLISSLTTTTNSAVASLSVNLSVTTSTANSG